MQVKDARQLGEQDYRMLALWAADCAEHVLPLFEEAYAEDERPRRALEAGRAWALGEIAISEARAAAFAALAAGHAAATVHDAGHAAAYALAAATSAAVPTDADAATAAECDWQCRRLPEHLRQ